MSVTAWRLLQVLGGVSGPFGTDKKDFRWIPSSLQGPVFGVLVGLVGEVIPNREVAVARAGPRGRDVVVMSAAVVAAALLFVAAHPVLKSMFGDVAVDTQPVEPPRERPSSRDRTPVAAQKRLPLLAFENREPADVPSAAPR